MYIGKMRLQVTIDTISPAPSDEFSAFMKNVDPMIGCGSRGQRM